MASCHEALVAPVLADLIPRAREVVEAAKRDGRFDYDRPIEGLRAIDRYTFRIQLKEAHYPNVRNLPGFVGAIPREVVEDAKGDVRARPVGTGPYRLREWKRGSKLVLEAHPGYREAYFPGSGDPADAELVAAMKGRRVPMAGRIEVNIVDEDITRRRLFEKGDLDFVQLRGEVATRPLADGKLKPPYAARGIARHVSVEPFLFSLYFNMKDPVVGGMTHERVALRRAIAMAWDADAAVTVVLSGQAMPAGQMIPPGVTGHDPGQPPRSICDPRAANALLDCFGYDKRDQGGFRTAPGGSPLTVTLMLRTGGASRDFQTLWKRNLDAIGLRTELRARAVPGSLQEPREREVPDVPGRVRRRADRLQHLGPAARDPAAARQRRAVPQRGIRPGGRALPARAKRAGRARRGADDERDRPRLHAADARLFRLENTYTQPWLLGYRPMAFSTYWKYLDVDVSRRK